MAKVTHRDPECNMFKLLTLFLQKNLSWLPFQIHIPAERWRLKSLGRCGTCHGLALLCDSHGPGEDGWQNAGCCLCLPSTILGFIGHSAEARSVSFLSHFLGSAMATFLATAEVTFYPVAMNRAKTSLVIYCLP